MFVASMTTQEIIDEIVREHFEIDKFLLEQVPKTNMFDLHRKEKRRLGLRKKNLYLKREFKFESPNNNNWLLLFHMFYKVSSFNGFCRTEDKKGKRVISFNQSKIFNFSGHFFSRFSERYNFEAPDKNTDNIRFYFQNNYTPILVPSFLDELQTYEYMILSSKGIGLAVKEPEKAFYNVKTFLGWNNLKKSQLINALEAITGYISILSNKKNWKTNIERSQNLQLSHSLERIMPTLLSRIKNYI